MRLPGPKPTLNIDDLVRTLHHHWVLDEHVYPDERYRITLHLIMLWGAYTAQRPVSFFGRQTRRSRQLIEQHEHNEIFIPGPDDYAEGEPTTASIDWLTELATDDQAADGPGAVTILYEHVHLLKVRQYESEILVLFVCIVHSKGEDKKPQP